MNQKTKDKIEAMYPMTPYNVGSQPNNYYKRQGATPWAEWCERLAEELEAIIDVRCGEWSENGPELLKEYRQWLEGEHEQG